MNLARRIGLVLLVVAGVASNLATTVGADECDGGFVLTPSGDGQVGAATAPLGAAIALRVQCRGRQSGRLVEPFGYPVNWTASGAGLVDGRASKTTFTGLLPTAGAYASGSTAVNWQLGTTIGEQTVTARVADQTFTFRASAGGPASGGTCAGGAGTTFEAERSIVGDERWVLAGSPYRGQKVSVHGGATLTIEPGVQTCLVDLAVSTAGRLRAEGTAAQPLRMQPVAAPSASWRLNFGAFYSPGLAAGPNLLRNVQAFDLVALDNLGQAWEFEDSQLVFDSRLRTALACPSVRWTVGLNSSLSDAVRRVLIDGYGSPPNSCDAPAVTLTADALPRALALPFEARVLRSAGDAVRVAGSTAGVFVLANCEVSGSGRHGVVFERAVTGTGAVVAGCNIVGNVGFGVRSEPAGTGPVLARGNWWGDAAGPPTAGPNAAGAAVDAALPLPAPVPLGY